MYTPEQRLMYPSTVGVITMKEGLDYVIDPSLIQELLERLNEKGLVWLSDYRCSIHSFAVVDVREEVVKDKHRTMIDKLINIGTTIEEKKKSLLSLKASIEGLKKQNQQRLHMIE